MAGSSASLHEDVASLKPETIDRHRAVVSIMEELEAIDWYDQRFEAARDPQLKEVLAHNRDEEKESLLEIEEEAEGKDGGGKESAGDGSLGIGSLRS